MKHTIEQINPSRVKIAVAVEEAAWVDAQEKAFEKVSKKVVVKGFRPGKAPKNLLKEKVNQEAVWNEAIDTLLNPTFAAVLAEEKSVRPFFRPNVDITKINDKELEIAFTIITAPSAKLGEYKGLTAAHPAPVVSEEEVAAAVARRFESNAEMVLVDRPAKMGDTVTIDFDGFLPDEDGNLKPFDGGKADNYSLLLGSGSFVPGFEDAIVGMKAGETKSFPVTFPEKYVKELAGKKAQFTVKLHEVKEKIVPAADDAAVKELGLKDISTLEELKAHEKQAILERKARESEDAFFNAIMNKIVAGAEFVIDEQIIANEAAQMEQNLKKQVEQNGITFEQYLDITGGKIENIRGEFFAQAKTNLEGYIVMNAIGEAENLFVTDADVDEEIKSMAEQYKMDEKDIRGYVNRDLDNFKTSLFNRKIRNFIMNNSAAEGAAEKKAEAKAKKPAAKKDAEEAPADRKAAAKKTAAKKTTAKKAE